MITISDVAADKIKEILKVEACLIMLSGNGERRRVLRTVL